MVLKKEQYSAVDLFCGAGGLTHGLRLEGIQVNAGIDFDKRCEFAFEHNNASKFIHADISEVEVDTLIDLYPPDHIKILAGCAPCQPFSRYSQGLIEKNQKSSKWCLLHQFARLVLGVLPEIVTMENVPNLIKYKVFDEFVESLESKGYCVTFKKVFGPKYGIPQRRERLVLLASLLGPIDIIPETHSEEDYLTVEDAIGHLEPLVAGKQSSSDRYHRASNLSELNLRRIKASRPGGTWRDWPEDLVTKCHRKQKGERYGSVYGRMEYDKPSPTITTQSTGYGSGRFGHPVQDRALSLREAAILQTFPDDYQFVPLEEKISTKAVGMMIGNAVPVELGRVVGKSIITHLNTYIESSKVIP